MNEIILNALMQLFAIIGITVQKKEQTISSNYFESFLRQYFSKSIIDEKMQIFSKLIQELKNNTSDLNGLLQKIDGICEQLNIELHKKDKILILIYLAEFVKHHKLNLEAGSNQSNEVKRLIENVVNKLNLEMDEYIQIQNFIADEIHKIENKNNILHVNNGLLPIKTGYKQIIKPNLQGHFFILLINSCQRFLLRYKGNDTVVMGNKPVFADHVYILEKGAVIKWNNDSSLYFNEIASEFLAPANKSLVHFEADDVNYLFPHSNNGIHGFSFSALSGQMIGIMGSSGSGKSTLLNILNGTINPQKGEIRINGYSMQEHKALLNPLIGYIPQDDLLIEELTVYQNLYYCTKISYGNLSEEEIQKKTVDLLKEINLFDYKDLKVGSPLSKFISGGQRKRLNIAFELIREPYILFVDEPTSGLSTSDSEKMMDLLRQQTHKGKLLFVNIHQPSSEIFKQFDKLIVLDKEGYLAFTGNPIDAIVYFKNRMNRIDADEAECARCGNISSEIILTILEYPKIDTQGDDLNVRKTSAAQWHQFYLTHLKQKPGSKDTIRELPEIEFKIPSLWNQFITYSRRNIQVKLADRQYLLISLLIAPFLALILAYISKFVPINEKGIHKYQFIENENLPAFLFMSVIVSLFIGLTISAEEIFKDKKILLREAFVNLSRFSYLNSKILFLFFISAFQMLVYVFIASTILEIKGMTFPFWATLFSLSCFANVAGLNISSGFKSVVTIYIIIPLILVPQILLSGAIIKFDKLHYTFTSDKYVPVLGDLMASRWAFEGLMVNQFKQNQYQKYFYAVEKDISEAAFKINYVIPYLENSIHNYLEPRNKNNQVPNNALLINNELTKMFDDWNVARPASLQSFPDTCNDEVLKHVLVILDKLKHWYLPALNQKIQDKDDLLKKIAQQMGKEQLIDLKTRNYNNRLSEFVLNSREIQRYVVANNQIVQLYEPIFNEPRSHIGRAQFYAPVKIIGNITIDTLWFNMGLLWIMTLLLYVALYYNWLFRIIKRNIS
ncbi:MAG: ATP-binding cassette domain-containing protein [Salinivirgaceae bacterium]